MNEQYRTCPECGKKQKLDMYLPTSNSSVYNIKGMSYICIECIANKIDRKDLGSIDKMCQFLDIPYDANKWIEMEKRYEKLGPLLIDYCQEMMNGKYVDNDWFKYNKIWEKCREYDTVVDELTALHSDLLMFLRKK